MSVLAHQDLAVRVAVMPEVMVKQEQELEVSVELKFNRKKHLRDRASFQKPELLSNGH